jgi:hypothetical protein
VKAATEALIAVVFLYLFYLVLIEGVAALVEHRRRGERSRAASPVPSPSPEGHQASVPHDVSPLSRHYRRLSRTGFVAQFLLSPLLAVGIVADLTGGASLPSSVLAILLLGAGAVAGRCRSRATRLGFTSARWRDAYVRLFAGKRPLAAAILLVLVAALLIGSTWLLSTASIGLGGDSPNWWIVVASLAGLALSAVPYRAARRIASLNAREAVRKDERPVVLYLRSFADDEITVRVQMSGASSLLEVLWPRRHERFEDVVAKILSRMGPVVAVGWRGGLLPPAGAARDVLSDDEWRQGVERWMTDAQLIVVLIGRTVGLAWELHQLSELQLWNKTLLLFPPIDDQELSRRWQATGAIIQQTTGCGPALAGRLSETAVVALQGNGEAVTYTADQRDDRSYEVALRAALADSGRRHAAGPH